MTDKEQMKEENKLARKWSEDTETWLAHAASLHVPIKATFELTARCNLSCRMCYIHLDREQQKKVGEELTTEQWIQMGRQAAEAGTLYLLLTGGEVLIRPDFPEIYTALCKMGFLITVYTNATLIDEKVQKLFEKYPPFEIGITLYGASPETYETVCGNRNAFCKVIEGLERLKTVKTQLEIRTTFIKHNAGEMKELYKLATSYTPYYKITPLVFRACPGTQTDVDQCRLSPKEAYLFQQSFWSLLKEEKWDMGKLQQSSEKWEYDMRDKRSGYELEPVNIRCLASKCEYNITWDGHMTGCNLFFVPYTEPLKEGFMNAWERLPKLLSELPKPEKCKTCKWDKKHLCGNCPPRIYLETGSFDKESSFICGITNAPIDIKMDNESNKGGIEHA